MTEEERYNNYWVQTSTILHEQTTLFYEKSYSEDGDTPNNPNLELNPDALKALINIASEAISVIEGSGKEVVITIDNIEEKKYKL